MRFVIQSSFVFAMAVTGTACAMFYELPTTPIHEAAWKGDVPRIRQLVKDGADVNGPDAVGGTPLYWAARGGHALGPHQCQGEAEGRPDVIATLLLGKFTGECVRKQPRVARSLS